MPGGSDCDPSRQLKVPPSRAVRRSSSNSPIPPPKLPAARTVRRSTSNSPIPPSKVPAQSPIGTRSQVQKQSHTIFLRLRAVLLNKYCANCLAHQHSGPSCRSRDRCRICCQPHHTLLHFHETDRPATPRTRSPSNTRAPSNSRSPSTSRNTPMLQLKSVNVLPTAVVRIYNGEKTFDLRALIDPARSMPLSRQHSSCNISA
ncbi:hypothetical protein ACLKA6_016060 [Drosophila palustris]